MLGKYKINIKSKKLTYEFNIERKVTIIRDFSATGKSTLCKLIDKWKSESTSVKIDSQIPIYIATPDTYLYLLNGKKNSLIIFDDDRIVKSKYFPLELSKTDNYVIIITRDHLNNIPYSVEAIYEMKNIKKGKTENYLKLKDFITPINLNKVDTLIVEDSKSGYKFYSRLDYTTISSRGKSRIIKILLDNPNLKNTLIIVDGSAFGSEIEECVDIMKKMDNVGIIYPESFEYILLESDIFLDKEVLDIVKYPYNFIDSKYYFTWEIFFYEFIKSYTEKLDSYRRYNKDRLKGWYIEDKQFDKIKDLLYNKYISTIEGLSW